MQEAQLYAMWQNLARSGQSVQTAAYHLRVIEAGQLNLHRGPDFISAVFELNGTRITGDVEMHRHLDDWYKHQHHLDPFFKNVSLHVVLAPPMKGLQTVVTALSKRSIPSLQLDASLLPRLFQQTHSNCKAGASLNLAAIRQLALERLHYKIRHFQHLLENQPAEQIFYEYFLRILGYPVNAWSFQLLARRLPWSWLAGHWSSFWPGAELLYALYSGMAGFLPESSSDVFVRRLINQYQQFKNMLPAAPLSQAHWQFSGLRPLNHPHYRLAGWVALLCAHRQLPFNLLDQLFSARLPLKQLLARLKTFFRIKPQGYWLQHHILGAKSTKVQNRQFFGPARSLEIIINLLIPLFAARALTRQSWGFFEYLREFYLFLPLQCSYRKFKSYFKWLSLYQKRFPRQALMQALLQLHEHYCQTNQCNFCPVQHIIDNSTEFS